MTQHIVPADLLAEIGVDTLPMEEQIGVIQEMGDAIMAGILVRAVPLLDDASQKELETLLESMEQPEELETFLNKKIPTFQQILAEEVATFRGEAAAFYGAL